MVSEESGSRDQTQCKANPEDEEVCSGQGLCSCGTCVCSDPVSYTSLLTVLANTCSTYASFSSCHYTL